MRGRTVLNTMAGLALAAFGGLFAASPAFAACEGITNAFAYNECLAKQGPQRTVRSARRGDPEATVRGRGARGSDAEGGFSGSGISITRHSGRRVSAVIDPWAGVRSTGTGRKRR